MEEKMTDQEQARFDKLARYQEMGIDPFGQRYDWKDRICDVRAKYADMEAEELAAKNVEVDVAGRLMAIRRMGKASFVNLKDEYGSIQAWLGRDVVGEESYNVFKLADLGDIVGLKGTLMKSHTGELTIRVTGYTHITKCLKPLPEKFHGLTDTEDRFRKRYLDLIVNDDSRRIAIMRPAIIKEVRRYCDDLGFVEVETPVLSPIAGGAAARPFVTHHNALDADLYLRIATELNLKRLIVGGFERVYEMGRVFRNEGMDVRHNPEFTSVEIYQAFGDYRDLIEITRGIVCAAAEAVNGTTKVTYQGVEIDLSNAPQLSMNDAVKNKTGKDFLACETVDEARALADSIGVAYEKRFGIGGILNAAFEAKVEDDLIQPIFITHHPTEISPLAKKNPDDPRITDRFEFFVYGRELANGFTELNDPIDQRARFEEQLKAREAGDEEAHVMDEDFIRALEFGMPPTGGLGIGVDRLVMLLTDAPSIRDVLLFPTMKVIAE